MLPALASDSVSGRNDAYEHAPEGESSALAAQVADTCFTKEILPNVTFDQPTTVFVFVDKITEVAKNCVAKSLQLKPVGELLGDKTNKRYTELLTNESRSMTAIYVEHAIPESLENEWMDTVSELLSFANIVMFGSLSIASATYPSEEVITGRLRSLSTTKYDAMVTSQPSLQQATSQIVNLEVGNVITGVEALLLGHAEVRGLPAVACVTLREAAISVASAKAFENAWALLGAISGVDIEVPDVSAYRNLRRNDGYIHNTSNLYT
jgi:hypothetical protein